MAVVDITVGAEGKRRSPRESRSRPHGATIYQARTES